MLWELWYHMSIGAAKVFVRMKLYVVNADGRRYGAVAANNQKEAADMLGVSTSRMAAFKRELDLRRDADVIEQLLAHPGTAFFIKIRDYHARLGEWASPAVSKVSADGGCDPRQ